MKISISKRGFASKDTLYHGTSSVFLSSILKHGLSPTPPQRVWKEDDERNKHFHDELPIASRTGVYVTKDLASAIKFAHVVKAKFGGNLLLVIIEGQVRSAFHDENTLRLIYQHAFDEATDQDSFKCLVLDEFRKLSVSDTVMQLVDLDAVYGLLKQRLHSNVDLKFAKLFSEQIKTLRSSLTGSVKAMKFPDPVTFRGANRIVAILQLAKPEYQHGRGIYSDIKHLFGKIPDKMLDDYRRLFGVELNT